MLQHFLQVINDQEAGNLTDLARRMQISPGMTLQIADDLSKKGYLEEISLDCEQPQQTPCADCGVRNMCKSINRYWILTPKGKKAISENLSVSNK